jgi:hypothetical protein
LPSNAHSVGTLSLPLPAGAANEPLRDPLLDGLLDYLALWLNKDLNGKLGTMAGSPAEAVPAGRRYPYNPERTFVRNPIPALYLWRDEGPDGARHDETFTILRPRRISILHGLFIFSQQVVPTGAELLAGLRNAVDEIFRAAYEFGYRIDYGYNGDPLGTPIRKSLKFDGWHYSGCEGGILWKLPGEAAATAASPGAQGDGAVQRGFPSVRSHWEVHEMPSTRAPDAALGDRHLTVDGEGIEVFQRLIHP